MKSSICGLLGIEFPLLALPIRRRPGADLGSEDE